MQISVTRHGQGSSHRNRRGLDPRHGELWLFVHLMHRSMGYEWDIANIMALPIKWEMGSFLWKIEWAISLRGTWWSTTIQKIAWWFFAIPDFQRNPFGDDICHRLGEICWNFPYCLGVKLQPCQRFWLFLDCFTSNLSFGICKSIC